jgi:putative transposase
LSTGEQIANSRFLRQAQQRLGTAQRRLSRCQKGSKRREKAQRAVARCHRKVRNQRRDFLHKQSRRLVNRYGTIVFEQLAIAHLSKRPQAKRDAALSTESGATVYAPNGATAKSGLNKSIYDAGWRMFQDLCASKAAWAGRTVLFVDPRFTSQTCSGCGAIQKKALSERWHSCPACGAELDRDHNAALNILAAGKRLGVETPACPV